jgi:two-component system OmpR family response regulator
MKVLLVEDNGYVSRLVIDGLKAAGHEVAHAANGRDGIQRAAAEPFDAIIMDRLLPEPIDGLSAIEALRKGGNQTPILILSALSDVNERIRGLQAGGDDYLTKPFAFGELMARLAALTRRSAGNATVNRLSAGDLQLDLLSLTVTRGDREIPLQPREYRLLAYLMRHADQVVTRAMLLENVWNYHFDPQTNVVDVHISNLRQKIDLPSEKPILRTIRGSGYMLAVAS